MYSVVKYLTVSAYQHSVLFGGSGGEGNSKIKRIKKRVVLPVHFDARKRNGNHICDPTMDS